MLRGTERNSSFFHDHCLIYADRTRNTVRFSANVPLTIFIGERAIFPPIPRDVSDRGVYFYLGTSDSEHLIDRDLSSR